MVIANENIAKFIKNNNLNSIFRNHEKPKLDKISELKKILRDNSIIQIQNLIIKKILLIF